MIANIIRIKVISSDYNVSSETDLLASLTNLNIVNKLDELPKNSDVFGIIIRYYFRYFYKLYIEVLTSDQNSSKFRQFWWSYARYPTLQTTGDVLDPTSLS